MLKRLYVENYALIKQIDLRFNSGFTTITGETGAGKSIMLGALGLVLGNRVDTKAMWDDSKKCFVEAHFDVKNYGLKHLFVDNDLDYDDELILRREISSSGKSRAFVNDTPVNISLLKTLGSKLINIHSQHEILILNDCDFHLAMIDTFAGHNDVLEKYQSVYKKYININLLLKKLKAEYADQVSRHDYESFLLNELSSIELESMNLPELEQEANMLNNAEEIKKLLWEIDELFKGEPLNFLSSLNEKTNKLEKFIENNAGVLTKLTDRLNSIVVEIDDLCDDINRLQDSVIHDPEQKQQVEDKLNSVYNLLRKHQVEDIKGLIAVRDKLSAGLQKQSDTGTEIESLENESEHLYNVLTEAAKSLSKKRRKAIDPLREHLTAIITRLGMPDAKLEIEFSQLEKPGIDGIDKVALLFSANIGSKPDAINKIASGGELSRLMLAVKSVLSAKKLIPTVIFDEIDSGVSGEIAGKTGSIMKEMADTMQVIVITHLPQIAAKGTDHFMAVKKNENGKTVSTIKLLNESQRVHEIAKMLSDSEPTNISIANAKQLLTGRNEQ